MSDNKINTIYIKIFSMALNCKISACILFCLISVFFPFLSSAATDTTFFYIAKNGNDKNPGTSLRPFASFEKARDAARTIRTKNKQAGPAVIYIRKGTYFIEKSFELNREDSTSIDARCIYKAYPKEYVELNGGVVIKTSDAVLVTDKEILGRLPTVARKKVYQINLFQLGIKNLGLHYSTGFRRPYYPSAMEIFIDKKPLHVARYPNDSSLIIKKVIDPNGTIQYEGEQPKKWSNAKDAWMGGTFCWAWADDEIMIDKIDTLKKTIRTKERSMFNFETGQDYRRWYVFNLLEEIDIPNEYYIDNTKGILYFFPENLNSKNSLIEVSVLDDPMITLKGCANISFENISFENMRGMAAYMEGGENNSFKNCTFRNIGMVPIVIGMGVKPFNEYIHNGTGVPASGILGSWHEHIFDNPDFDRKAGKNNGIINCKIYNAGSGGVSLGGGNRKTLTAAFNYVINSDIYDINRLGKTYRAAVNVDGVGNIIKGNHLHNTSQIAIYIHGNDHTIQYNEVDHACQQAEDMGAVYMGRDPSETGHSIKYNYFHDIIPYKPSYRLAGLYFDDGASGLTLYGNIFYKVGNKEFGAIFVHGGRDFVFQNNIFIDCDRAIGNGNWNDTQWSENLSSDVWQSRLYKKINVEKPPYTTEYPSLLTTLKKKNGTSKAINNVVYNCREFIPPYYISSNNYETSINPGFVDVKKKNFNLEKKSLIFNKIQDFEALPFDKIVTSANNAGNPFDKYD